MQVLIFFFFNDTATTEIYTLSLHDALPIWRTRAGVGGDELAFARARVGGQLGEALEAGIVLAGQQHHRALVDQAQRRDRKSTRLNSSHANISYAVFCLKKKKKNTAVHQHHI